MDATKTIPYHEVIQAEENAAGAPAWQGRSTRCVHGGRTPNPYRAIAEPVVQAATFAFQDTQDLTDFMRQKLLGESGGRSEYGRYGNPTVSAAEARLAALEGAGDALLLSSGMAAISSTVLALLTTGNHLILTDDGYRKTRQFCQEYLPRLGILCSVVALGDYDALEAAITPQTRLIISESPTNPYLRVVDMARVAEIARRHDVRTLVDTTFATPLNVRPLEWGIDLAAHSATKYLGGHNDLLAGVVAGDASLIAQLRTYHGMTGALTDANTAGLLLRGLKTLALRMERHNYNGLQVATYLQTNPKIERVWYPALPSHPDHNVAAAQYLGFGGVVSFTVRGDQQATARFVDALRIPQIATSLGGCESLISQPALMAYFELSRQERLELGIPDNLVRLALGIEDLHDLIADLDQALGIV